MPSVPPSRCAVHHVWTIPASTAACGGEPEVSTTAPVTLADPWSCRERGEHASPTTTCAATASASTTTTSAWPEVAVPGHWRSQPRVRRQRRSAALPPPLPARRTRRRVDAASSRSTASSTRPTCGSTAPTSATPRATSSRTRSTSPDLSRLADEHVLAIEVSCSPQRQRAAKRNITGVLQHCDAIDPGVEPGRPVATGARRRDRGRAHRPAARAVPRRERCPRPPAAARSPRRRPAAQRASCAPRSTAACVAEHTQIARATA